MLFLWFPCSYVFQLVSCVFQRFPTSPLASHITCPVGVSNCPVVFPKVLCILRVVLPRSCDFCIDNICRVSTNVKNGACGTTLQTITMPSQQRLKNTKHQPWSKTRYTRHDHSSTLWPETCQRTATLPSRHARLPHAPTTPRQQRNPRLRTTSLSRHFQKSSIKASTRSTDTELAYRDCCHLST